MIVGSLSLSGVQVTRAGRTILNVASKLYIPSGDFVGVIGTNGAGKTTLLKVASGLIKPTSGTVRINDKNLAHLGPWARTNLRKHIGYIPQATDYNEELPFTLREVVAMGRTSLKPLLTRLEKSDYEIVDRWIDLLGLSQRRNQTFRSLSGGEQQKALIARAMAQDPKILLLDEPCSNLDFHWKYQITEIVDRLYRDTNITVLMVSHETSLLPHSCKRVILLSEGRIVAEGDVDQVLVSKTLALAYQCRLDTVDLGGRKYTVAKTEK